MSLSRRDILKAAGVMFVGPTAIPRDVTQYLIYFPPGTTVVVNPDGGETEVTNQDIAVKVLDALAQGLSMAMPQSIDGEPGWELFKNVNGEFVPVKKV